MEQKFAMPMSQRAKINALAGKRDKALDVFVKTKDKLSQVNEEIDTEKTKTKEKREKLLEEIKLQEELMSSCEEMKAQNESTIKKINKIIE